MKKIITIFALLFFVVSVNAQISLKLGLGADVIAPNGEFKDRAELGYGGSAQLELSLLDKIVGVATIGYFTFGEKDLAGIGNYSYAIIPVTVGVKYFLISGLYAEGNIGNYTMKVDVTVPGFGSASESESEVGYSIGAGICLPLGGTTDLDVSGKYVIIKDSKMIDLRAGVKFSL